jgi:hypothetical protein
MVRDKSARFVAAWKDSPLQRDQGQAFYMETGDLVRIRRRRIIDIARWLDRKVGKARDYGYGTSTTCGAVKQIA